MIPTVEGFEQELKQRNIQPSIQRLKVLEYLYHHRTHPTVDQIFQDLHQELPTLSKATVYNTLRALMKAELVRVITIEDNETRYDIQVDDHGHLKCDECGTIYNFHIFKESLCSDDLDRFQIRERNVYFKGICPSCLMKQSNG